VPTGPVQATELILTGRSRPIDLGRIERTSGPQYFAVACGAGADARIMGGTRADSKRRFGIGGYLNTMLKVLPEIRSTRIRLTVDGELIDGEAAVVLILNCGELIPPLVRVRREAVPDDGLFDLIALAADTPWQVVRGVWRAIQNVMLGTGETGYLWYARGREITIETDPPQPVQFDGDPDGETPVTAVIQPGVIRIMAPQP
jgi:diacylglycerol kinase family enzyme